MDKEIINLHQKWTEAEISDRYGIIEFCCDEIEILMKSEKPIVGKANFLNWLKESDNGSFVEDIEISNRQVICLNQIGSLIADFKTTIRTKDNKKDIFNGQHMWHLTKENDIWKVKRLTWKIENPNR